MIKEGRAYSILTDHLGTPTETYDADGNEVWSRTLGLNGEVIEENGNIGMIPFLFQGQYYDRETELAYNRFRYYSPQMGMYISQDPIGLAGGITNIYAYIDNTNLWVDLFGLSSRVLDKNLGGKVGDNKQAHHLIPEKVWNANEKFFNDIGLQGQRDSASNGILLFSSESSAIANNKAYYHRGRHEADMMHIVYQ